MEMQAVEIRKRPPAQLLGRILSTGVDHVDYNRLILRTEKGSEDWVVVCDELGEKNYAYAEAELKKGHTDTARKFFLNAMNVFRVGQYGLTEVTDEKLRLYHKLTNAFSQAAHLYNPPLEEVDLPYKGYNMHGWLHLPKNAANPCPVVLLIAGATGFKEEVNEYARMLVGRGMAVLNIDGPGQGVTLYFNGGCLDVETEKAHQVMLDFIEKDPRLDKNRIGILGSSTGGYYVARTAGADRRIKACVVWGGSYYPQEIVTGFRIEGASQQQPPHGALYLRKFSILFGQDPETVMKELFPKMTMEGLAENITCSLLIIHGGADPIFSMTGVQRIYEEAKAVDKTIKIYPGGWHCAAGFETEVLTTIVDWMEERLKKDILNPSV